MDKKTVIQNTFLGAGPIAACPVSDSKITQENISFCELETLRLPKIRSSQKRSHLAKDDTLDDARHVFAPAPSAQKLCEFFRRHVCNEKASRFSLRQCRILTNVQGNKVWEIELSFTRSHRTSNSTSSCTAHFACHRIGTFTTYSISALGREVWFDDCKRALALFTDANITIEETPPEQAHTLAQTLKTNI